MNCEQARPLIQLYADGELDAARILELEQHLRECSQCAPAWRNLQGLKKAVRNEALYFTAPAALQRQIRTELRSQVKVRPDRSLWNWLTTATSGLATACLVLLLVVTLNHPSGQQELAQEIVSSHIRSLMANHALDVISTDQHTVKPWFNGKLDFSPPVKDLATQGFPLIGGRLDYLSGHTVAALVYQRHKHVLNLFIWPAKEKDSQIRTWGTIQGYNLLQWSHAGMNFWLVSDLNEQEMEDFATLFAN
jgi:anti-sigma factor RsiW